MVHCHQNAFNGKYNNLADTQVRLCVCIWGTHSSKTFVIDKTGLEKIYSFLSLKSSIKDYFRLPKINNVHR